MSERGGRDRRRPRARRRPRLLRRDPRAEGRLAHGQAGRDRHPHRRERRRASRRRCGRSTGSTIRAQGAIRFEGGDITHASPHAIVKSGIAQSPEGRRLFPRMSVTENLEMGAFQRSDKENFAADMDRVFELFPRLHERRIAAGGDDVRRRAADVRDRPRAHGPAEAAPPRRAVDGARADLRRADLRDRSSR